jgi:uncharacterized protein (TIGR02246 family)
MKVLAMAVAMVVCGGVSAWAQSMKYPDVDKTRDAYVKAANAADVPGLVALYTSDAVLMPPDMPLVKGRANIEAFHRKMMDMAKLSNVTITPMTTEMVGDTAVDAGTYRQTVTPKGGTPMQETGKYVVLLKKEAGGWKLAYEIYNSDKPMTMPASAGAAPRE